MVFVVPAYTNLDIRFRISFFFFVIGLLWTAPEFLSKNATASKSKSGDVYSYGIILQEICTRTDPYGNTSFTPQGKFMKST